MPEQKPRALDVIVHDIWRNLPIYPSTFGPCCRCEIGSGRGGGPCLDCLRAELAALAGEELATAYIALLARVRQMERDLNSKAGDR